jgi:hypothetical protein
MAGCTQGLIGSLKTSSGGSASGKYCTSFQVSIACCTSTGVCADATFGLGATCSPALPEGQGWTTAC